MGRTAMSSSIVAGLIAFGIVVQIASGSAISAADASRDLAVGLAMGIPGAMVLRGRRDDLVGWVLVAASAMWFAGTLTPASGTLGAIGRDLQVAHRGLLLVVLVAPMRRATAMWMRPACVIVAAGAFAASVRPWATLPELLVIAAAVSVAAAVGGLGDVAVPWRAMWIAALAATALWVGAATFSRRFASLDTDARLLAYQLGVSAVGLAMGAACVARRAVVDEVVEVGRAAGLGGALGDRSLRIAFWDGARFRAADRSPVVPAGSQVTTELDLGAEGRVRIVHRQGLLDDVRVRADVEVAARLLAEHHRRTEDVRHHVAGVAASRARLIRAEDRAATVFASELGGRVLPRLDAAIAMLPPAGVALGVSVRDEVAGLAAGVTPTQLDAGLPDALREMAAGAPVATEVVVDHLVVSDAAARTLYFVAAEGLSNAIRHGGATTVTFHLTADGGGVELRVDDDGDGTIILRPGGGLVGLSDRLAAEGGILRCERRPSGGSTVRAWLPEGGLQPIGSQSGIVQRSV